MAQDIQNPGVGSALQRLFRLQGRVRPQLEEFVTPTVQVADLGRGAAPPEIVAAASQAIFTAVVGELPTARFEIPANTVAIIDRIYLQVPADAVATFFFGSSIAAPAAVAAVGVTDARVASGQVAGRLAFGSQVAALATAHYRQLVQAASPLVISPVHWVVGGVNASSFLEFQTSVANQAARCALTWREYFVG